jgi:hypothetical protein
VFTPFRLKAGPVPEVFVGGSLIPFWRRHAAYLATSEDVPVCVEGAACGLAVVVVGVVVGAVLALVAVAVVTA